MFLTHRDLRVEHFSEHGYLQTKATQRGATAIHAKATMSPIEPNKALSTINVEDNTTDVIRTYMDLPAEGIKDVETLDHGRMSAYYGEYLTTKNM